MTPNLRILLATTLASCLTAGQAFADAQTNEQRACLNKVGGTGVKHAATQGKLDVSCLKAAGKDQLALGQTPESCLTDDDSGKVAGAATKLGEADADKCQAAPEQLPDFGYTGAERIELAGRTAEVGLARDLLGKLDRTSIDGTADTDAKKAAGCQASALKAATKYAATLRKNFNSCATQGLADQTIQDATVLSACVAVAKADPAGKAAKARDKILTLVQKKCAAAALTDAFLGGTGECGIHTGSSADFADCVAEAVNCRSCWYLNLTGGLTVDCDDYDDGLDNASCPAPVSGDLFVVASSAEPDETPGSPSVVVTNPELIEQFGGAGFSLNNAWYTRWQMAGTTGPPDAIFIAVAGFGGDANNFKLMAEDLIPKVLVEHDLVLEVWGFHRRTNQLEDRAGAMVADALGDPLVALDWYYGDDLGLTLDPALVAGPNRRANFYNTSSDIPFIANFTAHVNSKDIDTVVEAAHTIVANGNVFLGGHSAGTGFAARYAATDFDEGVGVEAGFSKLRGVVLLEGGGGSTTGAPLTGDSIDRIIAKADGGLFAAVRDNAPRCVDETPCTIATEAVDCVSATPPKCTEPVAAYSAVFGLSPQVGAASEPGAIQGRTDPDGGQVILQVDQGSGSAVDLVPELALLGLLSDCTVQGLLGSFLDDDGFVAGLSPAVATSIGGPGPVVGGLLTWQDITEGPLPPALTPDNGPPPTSLPAVRWGVEQELVNVTRYGTTFVHADANASDWYYSSSGLTVTNAPGRCVTSTCTVGNVGAACATNTDCAQSISLDSSAVSATRPDIVNLTQAAAIDIPVICLGGSNGLTPVPGNYVAFAQSVGTCTAPSCDGSTARVVDAATPNPAFPTFGDVSGGFEVHITEGFAHNDITSSEDVPGNNVLGPLGDFLARNVQ